VRIHPVQIDSTKICCGLKPAGVSAMSRTAAMTRTVEIAIATAKARIIHSR
jgi:hypothetical protein